MRNTQDCFFLYTLSIIKSNIFHSFWVCNLREVGHEEFSIKSISDSASVKLKHSQKHLKYLGNVTEEKVYVVHA